MPKNKPRQIFTVCCLMALLAIQSAAAQRQAITRQTTFVRWGGSTVIPWLYQFHNPITSGRITLGIMLGEAEEIRLHSRAFGSWLGGDNYLAAATWGRSLAGGNGRIFLNGGLAVSRTVSSPGGALSPLLGLAYSRPGRGFDWQLENEIALYSDGFVSWHEFHILPPTWQIKNARLSLTFGLFVNAGGNAGEPTLSNSLGVTIEHIF